MEFVKAKTIFYLNKSTYVNLRWIAIIGQLTTVLFVQFLLNFDFNYFFCIIIIFISTLSNIYLQFQYKQNQINNSLSTTYLKKQFS